LTHDGKGPLSSGRSLELKRVNSLVLRHYYVLACSDASAELTETEVAEMLDFASREGRSLSLKHAGDSRRYTLIFSGPLSSRRRGAHVHILVTTSRWGKAWLYAVLAVKNLLQAVGLRSDRRFSFPSVS
jgi:hypothetical protein